MDDVVRVGVVIVEYMGADAVDERRMQNVETLVPSENGGLGLSREWRKRRDCNPHGFVPRAADGAAYPIQQCARRLFADRRWKIREFCGHNVASELAGYIVSISVGCVLRHVLWNKGRKAPSSRCKEKQAA